MFGFPPAVNEKAARIVAAGVTVMAALTLALDWSWLPVFMAIGFALRVLAGPRFSPLGLLAARVIAPRLGAPVIVPGPPKQFAQTIGLGFTLAASVLWIGFGAAIAAKVLIGVLLVFAVLESAAGFCAGCYLFGQLMRWKVIPADTCEACSNIQR